MLGALASILAAIEKVGEGKVTDSEHEDGHKNSKEAYEVEVTRADGTQVDVKLDKNFKVLGSTSKK